jgi:hypothetical protein
VVPSMVLHLSAGHPAKPSSGLDSAALGLGMKPIEVDLPRTCRSRPSAPRIVSSAPGNRR